MIKWWMAVAAIVGMGALFIYGSCRISDRISEYERRNGISDE